MASQPHDKTDRVCSEPDCGLRFSKNSYNGSVIEKQIINGKEFIVQRIVCRVCHNKHFEQGE